MSSVISFYDFFITWHKIVTFTDFFRGRNQIMPLLSKETMLRKEFPLSITCSETLRLDLKQGQSKLPWTGSWNPTPNGSTWEGVSWKKKDRADSTTEQTQMKDIESYWLCTPKRKVFQVRVTCSQCHCFRLCSSSLFLPNDNLISSEWNKRPR